jgi:hypothetical protein
MKRLCKLDPRTRFSASSGGHDHGQTNAVSDIADAPDAAAGERRPRLAVPD